MGREIKRVALDFDWPLNEVWKGYVSPFNPKQCYGCKQGDSGSYGYTPEAQRLSDRWYGFDKEPDWQDLPNGRRWNKNAWQHNLNQEEVQILADNGRLMDFTHTWSQKDGWKLKNPAYVPTAEEVNEWSKIGMGHDSINQGYVVEHECKRLGVPYTCTVCGGSGELWQSPEIEKIAEEWEQIEPPIGEGWQLWETVSEGSPITPVFATPEELVNYMVNGDTWKRKWTRAQAEAMIAEGSTMSGMAVGGKFMRAEETVEYNHKRKGKK